MNLKLKLWFLDHQLLLDRYTLFHTIWALYLWILMQTICEWFLLTFLKDMLLFAQGWITETHRILVRLSLSLFNWYRKRTENATFILLTVYVFHRLILWDCTALWSGCFKGVQGLSLTAPRPVDFSEEQSALRSERQLQLQLLVQKRHSYSSVRTFIMTN